MTEKEFLSIVENYIRRNPETTQKVVAISLSILTDLIDEQKERAADMEVALSAAMQPRFKNRQEFIEEKVKKWEGKTSLLWEFQ